MLALLHYYILVLLSTVPSTVYLLLAILNSLYHMPRKAPIVRSVSNPVASCGSQPEVLAAISPLPPEPNIPVFLSVPLHHSHYTSPTPRLPSVFVGTVVRQSGVELFPPSQLRHLDAPGRRREPSGGAVTWRGASHPTPSTTLRTPWPTSGTVYRTEPSASVIRWRAQSRRNLLCTTFVSGLCASASIQKPAVHLGKSPRPT